MKTKLIMVFLALMMFFCHPAYVRAASQIPPFSAVDVEGSYDVEIICGKKYAVELVENGKATPLKSPMIKNGRLKLGVKSDAQASTGDVLIKVSMKNITQLRASINVKVTLKNVSNSKLTIMATNNAEIIASGKTRKLSIMASRAAVVNTKKLKANDAIVKTAGDSEVEVYVIKHLKAYAKDASSIVYYGNPKKVLPKATAAAEIIKK